MLLYDGDTGHEAWPTQPHNEYIICIMFGVNTRRRKAQIIQSDDAEQASRSLNRKIK
jgi:hypothetical protein